MTWGVGSYNINPALNTAINGVDISEFCPPGGYNDALRQIMADIATWTLAYAVTYPISIANGGTGATDAATARSNLGALAATYRDLVPAIKAASFTFNDAMCAKGVIYNGAAATATIDPYASTPIAAGGIIPIRNAGTGVLTVTPGAGVSLKKNGATSSASASLAIGAVGTLVQWGGDDWTIVGAGIS